MRAEMTKALAGPMAPLADFARQNMEQWSKIQASMMSAFAGTKPEPPPPGQGNPSSPTRNRATPSNF